MNEAVYRAMAPAYASLVRSNIYTLDRVPAVVRPYVQELLKENST